MAYRVSRPVKGTDRRNRGAGGGGEAEPACSTLAFVSWTLQGQGWSSPSGILSGSHRIHVKMAPQSSQVVLDVEVHVLLHRRQHLYSPQPSMVRTILLLLALCGRVAAQRMCWDVKQGYSAVRGMLTGPRQERRPELFYFGEVSAETACQAACDREGGCAAFTWMGASSGGGWLGGNNKWAMQCYGRGAQAMTMVPEKGSIAGIKVDCEQLQETERIFGTNPGRLVRAAEGDPASTGKSQGAGTRQGSEPTQGDEEADLMAMLRGGGAAKQQAAGAADGAAGRASQQQAALEAMLGGKKKAAGGQGDEEADLMAMLRGGGAAKQQAAGAAGGAAGRASQQQTTTRESTQQAQSAPQPQVGYRLPLGRASYRATYSISHPLLWLRRHRAASSAHSSPPPHFTSSSYGRRSLEEWACSAPASQESPRQPKARPPPPLAQPPRVAVRGSAGVALGIRCVR